MALDFEKAVLGSFAWLKNRESVKYVLMIFGVQIFLLIFSIILIYSTFAINFLGLYILFLIVAVLLGVWLGCITLLYALRSFGFSSVTFNLSKYIDVLILTIVSSLIALFWSFDKRLRIIQLFCLGLMVLVIFFVIGSYLMLTAMSTAISTNGLLTPTQTNGLELGSNTISKITGFATSLGTTYRDNKTYGGGSGLFVLILGGVIFIFLLIIYMAIVMYNSVRLSLSNAIFLSKEIGVMSALEESWTLTRGNVLNIFAVIIIVSIIYLIITFSIAGIMTSVYFAAGGKIPTNTARVASIESMKSANVQYGIFRGFTEAVTAPISLLTNSFMVVAIYSLLCGEKGSNNSKKLS
ncbi:MAG: hypothetical protein QW400_04045 [Candidatus Diapherotrites archaeon]